MPPVEDILRHLAGSWRMMNGKADGLLAFEISADGFWNSFFAIVIALPALLVGWLAIADDLGQEPAIFGDRLSILVRLAFIDLAAWLLPLAGFAAAAGPAGIADRFVHYVIASNWGSGLIAWISVPVSLLQLMTESSDFTMLVSVSFFLLTLVFFWRLTNAALAKGPAVATGVFGGMLVASLFVLFTLQGMFGLAPAP